MDELVAQGIGAIDIVVVNVQPVRAGVGAHLVGIDKAIEMIDVGGAALLGAAARNAAGVAAVGRPGALHESSLARAHKATTRSAPSSAPSSPPMRSGPSPRTTPRSRPT